MLLGELLDELPEELARQVFTHASWSERPSDSYTRLAFLGDSVLALAVTAYLYPRLEADRFGAGRLTKIRAQAVSGVSCRAVAERLALPERLRAAAPAGVRESAAALVETERVLASVIEAVIGACYLHAGYERTAEAVVEAFAPGDRGRAGASRRLQVGAAGAARAARRGGQLRGHRRGRPAARAHLRRRRAGRRARARQRQRQEQEARRAGGRTDSRRATQSSSVWRRWVCVLDRSRAEHATLTASLSSLPYVLMDSERAHACA